MELNVKYKNSIYWECKHIFQLWKHVVNSHPETGFLDDVSYDSISLGPGYDRPYQFNPGVREPRSIQLYKHLNLKSCIWTFDAYYDMTELIDVCGGSVTADFQVRLNTWFAFCITNYVQIFLSSWNLMWQISPYSNSNEQIIFAGQRFGSVVPDCSGAALCVLHLCDGSSWMGLPGAPHRDGVLLLLWHSLMENRYI